ncbi:LysR family transcriptional regulator [Amycolatopsis sp. 195334CR]|uniref:LysR substrate-binding domain-containing protein n=1 Tax=Amycolatopsis sp. 195334CR TaxID=2814588 RepID=UPI001A8F013E|nr:LysR family transcriptional regulator [Amycolatopsis sp. 195334CR]MBN6041669.1 LysR family transcriptional regulator [Amycolatopsis sp. 195334CR]
MSTLRRFEYLVAVVDEGSFTRAAERLHVTQPALSHQIRALERDAGGALLERLPRAIRLSAMGRAMLPHARAALADAERAVCAARQAAGLEAADLRVATVYSLSLGVLPPVLREWSRRYPGVAITLFEHRHTGELREAMLAGEADLAVGPRPADWDGPVRALGEEEFVLVLAGDDPAESSRLADFADRGWVRYAPENGLAEVLDQACAAAGFSPRTAISAAQTAAAPLLAAAGLGPALVPSNVLPAGFAGRVLRLDPPVCRELVVYTRGAPDPVSAAFTELLAAKF